jgi:hypothetical protein
MSDKSVDLVTDHIHSELSVDELKVICDSLYVLYTMEKDSISDFSGHELIRKIENLTIKKQIITKLEILMKNI